MFVNDNIVIYINVKKRSEQNKAFTWCYERNSERIAVGRHFRFSFSYLEYFFVKWGISSKPVSYSGILVNWRSTVKRLWLWQIKCSGNNAFFVWRAKSFPKNLLYCKLLHGKRLQVWVPCFIAYEPLCYSFRKWTRRHEFKSWTRLMAFHKVLIPLGKVWIHLFSLQLWVNNWADWVLQPWLDN